MTEQECKNLMLTLTAAYPNVNVPAQTHKVYMRLLSDLPHQLAEAAILEAINRCKFLPTIAEIRDIAASLATPKSLTAGEAWAEATRCIHKHVGANGWQGEPHFEHDLVVRAVSALGWKTIAQSEQIGVERAHFLRIYDQLAARETEKLRMLPEVRRVVDRLQAPEAKQLEVVGE